MSNFYDKYMSKLLTNESRTSYLNLKHYSGEDYRLVYGTCKKKGLEPISKLIKQAISNEVEDEFKKAESERSSLSRAKREIIEISRCNDFSYFVTLTLNSSNCDRFHLEQCQNLLRKSLKEYQRRCSRLKINFKYLIVTEKHEKGGFHFHGLFSSLIPTDIILNSNGYPTSHFFNNRLGFFSFSPIKNKKSCAFYISKYITKCPIKNETNQLYFCSKGLARAEVFDLPQEPGDLKILENFWKFENDYVKICDFDFNCIPKEIQIFLTHKKE